MGILDKSGNQNGVSDASAAADSLADRQSWWNEPGDDSPPPVDAPELKPAPCSSCGSPVFWQDIYGNLHCGECVRIPSRRLVRRFWYLYSAPPRWGPLDEEHWARFWNPFEHLDAAAEKNEGSESF